ncbi:MAG: thiamine diphosphokinase [Moheibacter sp.]
MNRAILFISGKPPSKLPDLNIFDKIYCTDSAYFYLYSKKIKPDVISGDFDNFDLNVIEEGIEVIETPDQDYTDFEKALRILIDRGFEEVHVYGGSGREQDHYLGNLSVAFKYRQNLSIIFFDDYSYYFFAEKETQLQGYNDRMVSLYPFPETIGIVTEGLKYSLNNEDLTITGRIGIRNTAVDDVVKITFQKGGLLIFIENRSKEGMV